MISLSVSLSNQPVNGSRTILLNESEIDPPESFTKIGDIEFDPDNKSVTLWHYVRDVLYANGIQNMSSMNVNWKDRKLIDPIIPEEPEEPEEGDFVFVSDFIFDSVFYVNENDERVLKLSTTTGAFILIEEFTTELQSNMDAISFYSSFGEYELYIAGMVAGEASIVFTRNGFTHTLNVSVFAIA